MNMKKAIALALATGMTLSLAACGGGSDKPSGSTAPAPENSGSGAAKTEITMWTYPIGKWGGTEAKVDEIISAFNAEYPDITLKVEFLDYANGDTQVTSAITAGNTPDIIMEGPERLVSNWGAAGKMVDLADLWTEESTADIAAVSESVVNACKGSDGVYYESVSYTHLPSSGADLQALHDAGGRTAGGPGGAALVPALSE